MQVATGTVIGGKVVVEGVDLEEGAVVAVLAGGANEPFSLTREDEDELLAAIAEIEARLQQQRDAEEVLRAGSVWGQTVRIHPHRCEETADGRVQFARL